MTKKQRILWTKPRNLIKFCEHLRRVLCDPGWCVGALDSSQIANGQARSRHHMSQDKIVDETRHWSLNRPHTRQWDLQPNARAMSLVWA